MIIRQVGRFSRDCGCAWDIIPPSELSAAVLGRLPVAARFTGAARFIHRCGEHAEMCRSLEPWELNLGSTEHRLPLSEEIS